MLMAILYGTDEFIAASAPACDLLAYGSDYWFDVFPGHVDLTENVQTAFIVVEDPLLQSELLKAGIDQDVNGHELAIRMDQYLMGGSPLRDAA